MGPCHVCVGEREREIKIERVGGRENMKCMGRKNKFGKNDREEEKERKDHICENARSIDIYVCVCVCVCVCERERERERACNIVGKEQI